MKRIALFFVSMAVALSMMPNIAFAEDMVEETEPLQTVQSTLIKNGKFKDDGDKYSMGDTSKYKKTMHIYSFYLGNSDEFGDAVLIESSGKYLLMDTGHKDSASKLVKYVKGVMGSKKKLNIYISHMHGDHTGGLEAVLSSFDVGIVFFPDIETCKNYETPNTGKSIDRIYAEHVAVAKKKADKVVYLRPASSARKTSPRAERTYSRFNVGGAVCKVMGPLGTYEPDDFISYVKELNGRCGTKEGHCLNNSSLCTKVTCGKTSYLATGDVEKHEEEKLVKKYGTSLNSDIMKLPHHGLRTSTTEAFTSKVTPMWSFAQDHGFTSANKSAINTAMKYGYNYRVAANKHSIAFAINKGKVRVYRDINNNNKIDDGILTGWVATNKNYQYYNSNGYIRTGWRSIDGSKYYMDKSSGFRYTGTNTIKGTKCTFDAAGKLTDPKKPAKAVMTSATAQKDRKALIKWEEANNANGYKVYRSEKSGSGYDCIGTCSSKTRSFTDKKLVRGKTYYYKIRAIKSFAGTILYGDYSNAMNIIAK